MLGVILYVDKVVYKMLALIGQTIVCYEYKQTGAKSLRDPHWPPCPEVNTLGLFILFSVILTFIAAYGNI